MEQEVINRRLDSQDKKLDSLLAKFDIIIRLEERHSALSGRVEQQADRIHKHANILMELQHRASVASRGLGSIERFVWLTVAAGFSFVAFAFRSTL